jgi:hypothetical protein
MSLTSEKSWEKVCQEIREARDDPKHMYDLIRVAAQDIRDGEYENEVIDCGSQIDIEWRQWQATEGKDESP